MSNLSVCAALSFLVSSTAFAADPPAPVPVPTPIDAKYNIVGIRIGMTPKEVEPLLRAIEPGKEPTERTDTYLSTGEKYVSSVQFIHITPVTGDLNNFDVRELYGVLFSTPATGNKAYVVHRGVTYRGTSRPLMPVMNKALEEKYGQAPNAIHPYKTASSIAQGKFLFSPDGKLKLNDEFYMFADCDAGINKAGPIDSRCGGVVLDWRMEAEKDQDMVDELLVTITDHAFATESVVYDKAQTYQAFLKHQATEQQEHAAHIEELSKTAAPPKL